MERSRVTPYFMKEEAAADKFITYLEANPLTKEEIGPAMIEMLMHSFEMKTKIKQTFNLMIGSEKNAPPPSEMLQKPIHPTTVDKKSAEIAKIEPILDPDGKPLDKLTKKDFDNM